MAEDPWNRVNVPFPSAVSSVRIPFSITTDTTIKHIVGELEKVLKLLESRLLQTEIRVLYALLYVLNNSLRQHKHFRAIKQVEQCINRLKEMKLDAALLELREQCPKKVTRQMATVAGHCEVPSQPMLEWFCLKVLGAASLMSCLLNHCTRAFTLVRQHLRCGEFVILNVVLTSMVSRLWVFFRGILGRLAPLYQKVLELLREVSQAQPMPSLHDFTLPADMTEFLGPLDSSLLKIEPPRAREGRRIKETSRVSLLTRLFKEKGGKRRNQPEVRPGASRQIGRLDLGKAVSCQRMGDSVVPAFDVKALLKRAHGGINDLSVEQEPSLPLDAVALLKRIKAAVTFREMTTDLEELIQWCKCKKMKREKSCLVFLHLRFQQMKRLEAAGQSVQKKLGSYKRQVSWALTLRRAVPRTCQSLNTHWRSAHPRTRFQPLRTKFQTIRSRVCTNRKRYKRQRKRTELLSFISSTSKNEEAVETSVPFSVNIEHDIDDIFGHICP